MTEFKEWHFSHIGTHLAYKQDKGLRISVSELLNLIESNNLIQWIETNVCGIDFWDVEAKYVMNEEFSSIANCYDYGIENDGIARLIAYCFAFVNNLPSRTIKDL